MSKVLAAKRLRDPILFRPALEPEPFLPLGAVDVVAAIEAPVAGALTVVTDGAAI